MVYLIIKLYLFFLIQTIPGFESLRIQSHHGFNFIHLLFYPKRRLLPTRIIFFAIVHHKKYSKKKIKFLHPSFLAIIISIFLPRFILFNNITRQYSVSQCTKHPACRDIRINLHYITYYNSYISVQSRAPVLVNSCIICGYAAFAIISRRDYYELSYVHVNAHIILYEFNTRARMWCIINWICQSTAARAIHAQFIIIIRMNYAGVNLFSFFSCYKTRPVNTESMRDYGGVING